MVTVLRPKEKAAVTCAALDTVGCAEAGAADCVLGPLGPLVPLVTLVNPLNPKLKAGAVPTA